jgi:hypothetical protein
MPADVLLLGLALDTSQHSLLSCRAAGLLAGAMLNPVLLDIIRHFLAVLQDVLLQALNGCLDSWDLRVAVLAFASWALPFVCGCSNRFKLRLADISPPISWLGEWLVVGLINLAGVYLAGCRGHSDAPNAKYKVYE